MSMSISDGSYHPWETETYRCYPWEPYIDYRNTDYQDRPTIDMAEYIRSFQVTSSISERLVHEFINTLRNSVQRIVREWMEEHIFNVPDEEILRDIRTRIEDKLREFQSQIVSFLDFRIYADYEPTFRDCINLSIVMQWELQERRENYSFQFVVNTDIMRTMNTTNRSQERTNHNTRQSFDLPDDLFEIE